MAFVVARGSTKLNKQTLTKRGIEMEVTDLIHVVISCQKGVMVGYSQKI